MKRTVFFHRDVMSPTGAQTKAARPGGDKGVALTEAIAEIVKAFTEMFQVQNKQEVLIEKSTPPQPPPEAGGRL